MNVTAGVSGFQPTHGMRRSPEYTVWAHLKDRCHNPNSEDFKYYGARGISVCSEWRGSFPAFYRDMGPRPKGGTIERENNNGNYEPGNCVWVSHHRQCNNRRSNVFLVHDGERKTVADWAASVGLSRKTLTSRLNHLGWSVRRALNR